MEHDLPVLQKQTQWDDFLMPPFAAQGYKGNDLRLLNKCRYFLQAVMADS